MATASPSCAQPRKKAPMRKSLPDVQVERAQEGLLAACANWVIDKGVDKVTRANLATLLVDAVRDVPVRQGALEAADGTLRILDVVTNPGRWSGHLFVAVANPERTRNVFFVTRTDAVLRRTAASGARSAAAGFGFVLPE